MPADYASTAQALSLPISPIGTPTPTTGRSEFIASSPTSPSQQRPPPWVRPNRANSSATRLSTTSFARRSNNNNNNGGGEQPLGARILRTSTNAMNWALRLYSRLTFWQQMAASAAGVGVLVLGVVFLVFSHRIFAWLMPFAQGWRDLPGGWLIVWLMTFGCAFPPMIGYSTTITIAGLVYGFPGGWPIVATATVAGSTTAFFTSRTVFSSYVDRLVGNDKRFVALSQVLRHDGLWVLAAIRFCPLPYSLSNGFLATIPSISPLSFARLALLGGDAMTAGDKAINYLSMLLSMVVGTVIGLVIYRRTMARAKELALEEAAETGGIIDPADEVPYGGYGDEDGDLEQGILSTTMGGGSRSSRRGETDAAALMDDDDISLWETDAMEHGYRDDDSPHENTDK
ncbi:Golgi apparatus membrane protein [Apiospora phragmitis]|uniref:Golgi apparatus membrane protein TVP38 n=1 Tax=Apiospora phragmitis TaxID=2905665 RepID=A0ABR1TTM8_9PEZI